MDSIVEKRMKALLFLLDEKQKRIAEIFGQHPYKFNFLRMEK
jgi:hypothetical protein